MTSKLLPSSASISSSLPPDYHPSDLELSLLTTTTSSPPTYSSAISSAGPSSSSSSSSSRSGFHPTLSLQIETRGKPWLSAPLPQRPDPIPIFAVSPSGTPTTDVAYVSRRHTRSSGSSYLVRSETDIPLATTTYRFGPGKPPKIRLLGPNAPATIPTVDPEDPAEGDVEFEVVSKSVTSRTVVMRTPYGTFEWRYATRKERKEEGGGVDSLLVLDRVVVVATIGGGSEERRTRVAQLVRAEGLRSEGSGRSTAGNGGRLLVDLAAWTDTKDDAEMVERLVVASAICMLKKEIDRRRMHQWMIIAGAAGGGP